MYVIEVIPLTRGANIESLTYYSSVSYGAGVIIEVPVRKSSISAMVLTAKPLSAAKAAVRAATFTLKKLPEQSSVRSLPPSLVETAKSLMKTYPAQLGAIIFALLPPEVRDGSATVEHTTPCSHADIRPEIEVLSAKYPDRFISYRSKIREVFAHRGSVLFVIPTSADIDQAVDSLSQGIESRVVVFSPTQTKKKSQRAYESFYDLSHSKLIVTTPSHAYLDRHDLTHIIVDQSRSQHYKSKIRPYLDHRDALKTLALVTNRTMTLGDLLLRSEDEYRRREELYATAGEHPKRLSFEAKLSIIKQNDEPTADQPFELFDKNTLRAIKENVADRKQTFVYAARRGLAPVVVCNDCGHIFRCPDSGAPYSLFKTNKNGEEERWFLSQTSGKRVRAADTCSECGSWRLRERGIGIQHIERELRAALPKTTIVLFDHTTATTYKKARTILGKFYETKGAILLGTQMVLPYLEKPVELSVLTSHDAARSIPSWRAEEEFLGLLFALREVTNRRVILQTRTEPDELIEYAKQGAIQEFYNDELELRQSLKYPPFSVFILLSWQGHKDAVTKTETELAALLAAYKPRFYSAPHSLVSKTKRYGLIRVPSTEWPRPDLVDTLRGLPPNIKIEINPDRIV